MGMEILAILMVAFCLFAILMFILFYIYAKRSHNERNYSDDYQEYSEEVTDNTKNEIELVDVMINGSYYVFDANNYQLSEDERVELIIDGNVFNGIVTKGNYKDNLDEYTQIPTKLILKEKDDINTTIEEQEESVTFEPSLENDENSDEEFIPIKKNN